MRLPRFRVVLALLASGICGPTLLAGQKIGVVLKGRAPFWSAMEKGALDSAAKLGVELLIKSPSSETDVSVQIQLVNSLATQGIDALVIAPCSKDALAAPVAALAAKGVKIVVLDSPLDGQTGAVMVATDQKAAGATAGRLLAMLVSDTDEVSFLKHSQTSGASGQRESGALATFREAHPKSTIHADIYASAENNAEMEKARLLLATYPATKAILASGTAGTMAMLRVLQEKKLGGTVKLVGFGFNLNSEVTTAIESGALHGWIAQLPGEVGAKGIATAVSLLKGETVAPFIPTEFIAITKENVNDPKVQALLAL